jgi:hypothetical protein
MSLVLIDRVHLIIALKSLWREAGAMFVRASLIWVGIPRWIKPILNFLKASEGGSFCIVDTRSVWVALAGSSVFGSAVAKRFLSGAGRDSSFIGVVVSFCDVEERCSSSKKTI